MADFARNENAEQQLQNLSEALKSGELQPVRRMIEEMSAAEIAALLESLPPDRRGLVWQLTDAADDGEILVHVADEVRSSLIEVMDNQQLVAATSELELDDLADILNDLPDQVIKQILDSMDRDDRERLAHVLSYPEDSAGGLMNPDVVTVRRSVTLDVVLRFLRMRENLPSHLDYLYVVDREGRYHGRIPVLDLILKPGHVTVSEIMDTSIPALRVDQSEDEVATQFEHHDWVSAPVVDESGTLVGIITIDDIVDVIRDQAEHSVMSMAGLDEEEDMFAPVLISSRRRGVFLGVNLITAFIAAWFVGIFEAAIAEVVALAVLMPVIASMGGIAGTQTLTLMIRGMAVGQIGAGNTTAILNKELAVGGLNGIFWALVVGAIALIWFKSSMLGMIAAFAILINLIAGALAGVVVPVVLRRMNIDPALAGGMVLTTVTDVCGFVTFLGLGSLLLT